MADKIFTTNWSGFHILIIQLKTKEKYSANSLLFREYQNLRCNIFHFIGVTLF